MENNLYLFRCNIEFLLGPMSSDEFSEKFKNEEIKLNDEVSLSLKPWVKLKNDRLLHEAYPEIYKIIYEDLKVPISSGLHEVKQIKKRSYPFKILSNIALVSLCFVLFKILFVQNDISSEVTKRLIASRSKETIKSYIERNLDSILNQKDEDLNVWLPLLRWYAFENDGEIKGLSSVTLKGSTNNYTPDVCSEKYFEEVFKESVPEWSGVIYDGKVKKNKWLEILSWDPDWIKRRRGNDWLKPMNYMSACILMAAKVFLNMQKDERFLNTVLEVYPKKSALLLELILHRVMWLSYTLNKTSKPNSVVFQSNIFNNLTCIESSESITNVKKCHNFKGNMNNYLDVRFIYRIFELLFYKNSMASYNWILSNLNQSKIEKLKKANAPNSLDYSAEIQMLKMIVVESKLIKQALESTSKDFKKVNFDRSRKLLPRINEK